MDVSNFWWQSQQGDGPGGIGNSLRFRGVAPSLTRDVGVFAQGTYTYSFWAKISQSKRSGLFSFGNHWGTSSTGPTLDWNLDGSIQIFNVDASNANVLDGLYRDPSAWYHFVYVNETGVGTRVFVNGHQRYTSTTVTATSSNTLWAIGDNANIGVTSSRMDGYLADCYFIDGQALDPLSFGEFDDNGVWIPTPYTGTYGTNGFYLDFSDPADIGADRSGNGNDFTATGFELADQTSEDWDHMEDSPTSNWTTLNPLFNNGSNAPGTLSGANLNHAGITQYSTAPGTLSLKNGAYYFELTCGPAPATTTVPSVGIIRNTNPAINPYISYDTAGRVYGFGYEGYDGRLTGSTDGEGSTAGSAIASGAPIWVTGDVIGIRCDVPNNYIAWYHNNVLAHEVTNLNSEYDWMPAVSMYASPSTPNSINFGQRPFAYDIPAGYEALQTQNLPDAPIPNGRDHFRAITGVGQGADSAGAGQRGGNFTPGLTATAAITDPGNAFDGAEGTQATTTVSLMTWTPPDPLDWTTSIEVLTTSGNVGDNTQEIRINGVLVGTLGADAWTEVATGGGTINTFSIQNTVGPARLSGIRLDGEVLVDLSILALARRTFPNGLWWIKERTANTDHQLVDSINGTSSVYRFVLNNDRAPYSPPAGESVAWCWATPANGINVDAGFSITNGTHGLGKMPELVVNSEGFLWRADLPPTTTKSFKIGDPWDGAVTNNWVITDTTVSSDQPGTYYCWTSIPGYSKFGQYTGNGTQQFLYTGFRPAMIWFMPFYPGAGDYYRIYDSTIQPYNPLDYYQEWAQIAAYQIEATDARYPDAVDFYANGFQVRTSGLVNLNAWDYCYFAWAENPFGGSNVSPANAR